MMVRDKGSDFQRGFIDGYKERSKSKARGAKLGGGLLGTLAFLVLISA